jgi:ubiquitin C-terminal hydrolase
MANKVNYKNLFNVEPDCITAVGCSWVVGIDPSGSEKSGKGHTGIVLMCKIHQHVLNNYTLQIGVDVKDKGELVDRLSDDIANFVDRNHNVKIVVEDYVSYGDTMGQDAETKYVVDALHIFLKRNLVDHDIPIASEHKARFRKELLVEKGVEIEKLGTRHELDALKMCLYDIMFHDKKELEQCRKCRKLGGKK